MNHKKIQRPWRAEGLQVPVRRRHKYLGTSTVTEMTTDAPNPLWATDFQFDATNDGRPVKIVSIVDEHTREYLAELVERSITADRSTNSTASRPSEAIRRCCAVTTARNWCAR